MGNAQSSAHKKLFDLLDRDHNGTITLGDILHVQKLPESMGLAQEWAQSHSPLLLFRFDSAKEGSITHDEFAKLLKHLKEASKKVKDTKRKERVRHNHGDYQRSPSSGKLNCWTSVDENTKNTLDLDRDSGTPMITGKKQHPSTPKRSDSSEELDAEEFKELVRVEAKQFFENLIKKREGRRQFLKWLFHLTDYDHNNTVTAEELGNILDAVSEDGIMPEDLSFDQLPQKEGEVPHSAAMQILQQYDTGHYGFLTRDEFMVLADLILKNYELMPDSGENHIGKYILKRKLGTGASGVVWLAIDSETKAHRAIKMIHKGDVSDMSRVDCEIKAMLMLDHPNIVKLYEVLESEDHVFFVMELCGGGALSDHTDEPLAEEVARFYFIQLIKAVKYCHSIGVVHRDLKLENLLLDNNGDLKVTDFGHAGIFSKGWDVFSTGMVGSLWHISPEQLNGTPYSGEKIDLWAIGILLYRLLVGRPPFFLADPNEFIDAIQNLNYELPFHLSMEVKHLFQRILQPNPEERITLEEMLEHPWCQGLEVHPSLISQIYPIDETLDPTDCWRLLKEITQEMNIHFLDSPPLPEESATILKGCKCTRLEKELRFTIWLKVEKDSSRFLEFDLKSGESIQLKNTVEKIKHKFATGCKEVKEGKRVLADSDSDYYSSDSDDSDDEHDHKHGKGHDSKTDSPHDTRDSGSRKGGHDLRESRGTQESLRESRHELKESGHKDLKSSRHELKESRNRHDKHEKHDHKHDSKHDKHDKHDHKHDNKHDKHHKHDKHEKHDKHKKKGKKGKSGYDTPSHLRVKEIQREMQTSQNDDDSDSDSSDGYSSDSSSSKENTLLLSLKDALKTSLDFIKIPGRD
eukprot:TRINITY_DN5007_c0_g1_i1.p1 TRINITY_DN5007_c0_g1~~TRINITY_DN5007_c0_g1_i1.p1  ORF type:complete len:859 (-),score=265.14 TRINITY_DN5007_c0_g1_i1:108-2684(-)